MVAGTNYKLVLQTSSGNFEATVFSETTPLSSPAHPHMRVYAHACAYPHAHSLSAFTTLFSALALGASAAIFRQLGAWAQSHSRGRPGRVQLLLPLLQSASGQAWPGLAVCHVSIQQDSSTGW